MLAGQVDGTVGFYDHNLDLQGKGKAAESVVQFDCVPGEAELVSKKNVGVINSPADFKGKNLGVTSIGSRTFFLPPLLAAQCGLPRAVIRGLSFRPGCA